jgi:TolB-like protein/DNA-binding winged helix-turn-helix (wHTH) protein
MIFQFDDFEIDTSRIELRFQGRTCAVEPQVFSLLAFLVENRHRMVTREEIVETVWLGRAVSDSALSSRIKDARKALNDDGASQRYIRTVHGRGFRFVGEDVVVSEDASPPRVVAGADLGWPKDVLSRPALAVLPFENEGGQPEDAYLVDGVTEELIAELSSWRWFPILSRNSSFDRAKAHLPASGHALAIGAKYAVTGRLLRAGEKARLSIELLDASTDTQLWSQRYSCEAVDLQSIQAEIASRVFQKIAPELTSAETRRVLRKRPEDMTAWDLTIKGLWHLHRATQEDFSLSLSQLQQAIKVDQGFALPWSLISLAYFELALRGWTSGTRGSIRTMFKDMLEAAATSVELDPSGWMGHALMSAGELWTNFAFPKARFHANRALELNPSASMAYHFSGCIHGFTGDLDLAIKTQNAVYQVDPSYPHLDVIEADLGLWHLLDNDLNGARQHLDRALTLNPQNIRARQRQLALAGILPDLGMAQAALQYLSPQGSEMDETYLRDSYPFQNPDHAAIFSAGIQKAGLLSQ